MFLSNRHVFSLVIALAIPCTTRADVIVLKDGVVLQGKVKRETVTDVDPVTHEPFHMPRGFFLIDDGVRRVYFSPALVGQVQSKAPPNEEVILADRQNTVWANRDVPRILEVLDTTPFDAKWDRTMSFRTMSGRSLPVRQHLASISPYITRLDGGPNYAWGAFHLTHEFSAETIQQLLTTHSKFQITKDLKPADAVARRFRYCDFFAQAGWFEQAEAELERMLKDLPDQKERIDGALAEVAKMKARERLEDIKRLQLAGLNETARQRAAKFPEARAPEEILAALRELKNEQLDPTADRLAGIAKQLDQLPRLLPAKTAPAFTAMAQAVREELNPEGLARLETFRAQASQADRQRQLGRAAGTGPAELLSLAVTGWLLGNAAAEAKPDVALRAWKTREFLLEYLRTSSPGRREQLYAAFASTRTGAPSLDEVFQMVPHLPPPEAEANLKERTLELKVESAARRDAKFYLRLPPEYTHGRPWPLLIVLPGAGNWALPLLEKWAEAAGENGFLVAAPVWQNVFGGGYTFTDAEHGIVIDLLRDLRRRFNIDSDRVFLFGLGQGGAMAFDIGLSHPDLFAGVIPMGAGPLYFAKPYFRNAYQLPFYVVNGDRAGDSDAAIRKQFDYWAMRAYPALWFQYKGRGQEWFGAEIPSIFDWMRPKRRQFPLKYIGSDGYGSQNGNEFTMMRPGDNRCFWLSAESIDERCCTTAEHWVNVTPATMTAQVDAASNDIRVRVRGVKELRIWLGRNAKGQNLIDFDKPLNVYINLKPYNNRRKITPSLAVMLEDLYQRGDRQQLYLAHVDFKVFR